METWTWVVSTLLQTTNFPSGTNKVVVKSEASNLEAVTSRRRRLLTISQIGDIPEIASQTCDSHITLSEIKPVISDHQTTPSHRSNQQLATSLQTNQAPPLAMKIDQPATTFQVDNKKNLTIFQRSHKQTRIAQREDDSKQPQKIQTKNWPKTGWVTKEDNMQKAVRPADRSQDVQQSNEKGECDAHLPGQVYSVLT
jgi:hypothetical protein